MCVLTSSDDCETIQTFAAKSATGISTPSVHTRRPNRAHFLLRGFSMGSGVTELLRKRRFLVCGSANPFRLTRQLSTWSSGSIPAQGASL